MASRVIGRSVPCLTQAGRSVAFGLCQCANRRTNHVNSSAGAPIGRFHRVSRRPLRSPFNTEVNGEAPYVQGWLRARLDCCFHRGPGRRSPLLTRARGSRAVAAARMSAGWLGCRSSSRMAEFSPTLRRYLAAVSFAGLATLVVLVAIAPGGLVANPTPALALLALLVALGEVFPIKLPGDDGEFTTSTTFAFALLITGGCEKAMVALAAGSLITDLLRRRSPWRGAFNIAQYTLALAAAGAIVQLLTALPNDSGGYAPGDLPAILLAASAFFLVNNSLAGAASALAADLPIRRTLV